MFMIADILNTSITTFLLQTYSNSHCFAASCARTLFYIFPTLILTLIVYIIFILGPPQSISNQ